MSIFHGKQGKGAMRNHRLELAVGAYFRALEVWNDGVGRIHHSDGTWEPATHPFMFIPAKFRPEDVKKTTTEQTPEERLLRDIFGKHGWPVKDTAFPNGVEVRAMMHMR